jgi:hypothetical protein
MMVSFHGMVACLIRQAFRRENAAKGRRAEKSYGGLKSLAK